MTTGEHDAEQAWLDRAVYYLGILKSRTDDPDLQVVLDYCIKRYNHIGAWDVMVFPLFTVPGNKALGMNVFYCPGVTLDPEALTYPIHDGALILVHESLHDWWPYFGHKHITPRMLKLEMLRYGKSRH